ncbi:hypothetical protein RIF29_24929 [Crotalaria pallida]|uniref:Uncharacterized protein n=1 Tax=Crotalaria pallida TaxID=3830 RepID=A0AAN9EMV6_CROPI
MRPGTVGLSCVVRFVRRWSVYPTRHKPSSLSPCDFWFPSSYFHVQVMPLLCSSLLLVGYFWVYLPLLGFGGHTSFRKGDYVWFEDVQDAEKVTRGRDCYNFGGHRLRVELANGGRGSLIMVYVDDGGACGGGSEVGEGALGLERREEKE